MSRRQRMKRRRARGGQGFKIVAFSFGIVAVVLAIGALSGVAYILTIAADAPDINSLKPVDKGAVSQVYAADGRSGWGSSSPTTCARRSRRPDPRGGQAGHGRDRGPALLPARRRRLRGHRPRRVQEHRVRARRCRAGRRSRCSSCATSTSRPERTFKRKIKEAKLAEELENEHSKALDPRQVPQHRLLRHRRRAERGRRPGGLARCSSTSRRTRADLARRRCSPACPRPRRIYNPFPNPAARSSARNEVLQQDGRARR